MDGQARTELMEVSNDETVDVLVEPWPDPVLRFAWLRLDGPRPRSAPERTRTLELHGRPRSRW